MARPRKPTLCSDVDALHPAFRSIAKTLLLRMRQIELPMRVFETKRTLELQLSYFKKGVTRAAGVRNSPHVSGFAIDCILSVSDKYWDKRKIPSVERPQRVGDAGAEWDTGFEIRKIIGEGKGENGFAVADGCKLIRPEVAHVWNLYGEIAIDLGLEWGGKNAGPWRSMRPGDLFGWDVAHVQLPHWREFLDS